MLFLISSCVVFTLAMSSVALSDLDKRRKDELLKKWFASIKHDQSFYCLKPQTALQSSNFPYIPIIPGSNLNTHPVEDCGFVHTKSAGAIKLPLSPRTPVHNIHNIPWQLFPQPNYWESGCVCWSWACHLRVSSNTFPCLGTKKKRWRALVPCEDMSLWISVKPLSFLLFALLLPFMSSAKLLCPWRQQTTSPVITVWETWASQGMPFSPIRTHSKELSCIRKTTKFKSSFK